MIRNKYPFSIGNRKYVYVTRDLNKLIVADIQETEENIYIEKNDGYIVTSNWGSNVALSNDESKLAYVIHPDSQRIEKPVLIICQLSNFKKKVYKKIGITQVICWSEDDKEIIFSDYRRIYKLNLLSGDIELITTGYLPKVLPGGSLGFWRDKTRSSFCYKMDLNTRKETELFSLEHYLRGADWSPDGRYVFAYVFSDFLFIRECVGLPILIDTENGRKYRLPKTTSAKYTERKFKCPGEVQWRSK